MRMHPYQLQRSTRGMAESNSTWIPHGASSVFNGCMVSCFLTPSTQSQYTYPAELRHEISGLLDDEYMLDVYQFRTEKKDHLLEQICRMADQQQ